MLSFSQKLQSVFYPVSIRKGSSAHNLQLELFYYHQRYILATGDAVYSDAHRYKPLVAAFSSTLLKPQLAGISSVLVLGTGLASAVHVLDRMGFSPHFTLVEIDALILEWAREFLPQNAVGRIETVHADAFQFIEEARDIYDLIIIDIFFGRNVPEAVTGAKFLSACKARLSRGGALVLNYMQRRDEAPDIAKAALEAVFGEAVEISFGINKVYIVKG